SPSVQCGRNSVHVWLQEPRIYLQFLPVFFSPLVFYSALDYSPNEYAQRRSKISGSSSISLIASEYVVSKFSFAILWASSNDSATATQIPPYSKAIEFIGQR